MIKANVSLSGNNTKKASSSSIIDFILLKQFNVCMLWSPLLFIG
jgi:hypothetical protein